MNKTTEKILMSPVNALVWTSHNPADATIISVYICSLLPFFIDIKSWTMLGGWISFCSVIFVYMVKRGENKKSSRLYDILGLIILIMGFIAMYVLSGKKPNDNYSAIENFFCVYQGAFGGIIIGAFVFGVIENNREDKIRQQELDNRRRIIRTSIPSDTSSIVKSEKIPIRDATGEKIIGHIEKEKYDDFINKNLIKNE